MLSKTRVNPEGHGPPFLAFSGDLSAIKRMALEFCEDAADNGILYTEVRFCPHLLVRDDDPEVTPDEVVRVVLEGLREGEASNKIRVEGGPSRGESPLFSLGGDTFQVRLILCCINGLPQFSKDILRLCEKYRNEGVVGIDIAGSESAIARGGGGTRLGSRGPRSRLAFS